MRSHMMSLPIPPKLEQEEPPPPLPQPPPPPPPAAEEEADSASSSSSSSEEEGEEREEQEEEEDEEKELYYGLRENPKRSIRLVDPEFSFATAVDAASSVILQDRESETESSKNPTRRRSKRTRKSSSISPAQHQYWQYHKAQLVQDSSPNNKKMIKSSESEPVSSVSDTAATDEDIAYCLMMLSRDNWSRDNEVEDDEEDDIQDEEDDEVDEQDDSENEYEELNKSSRNTRTRGKYKCETCNKVFRSYQALGGHRAGHKKIKLYSSPVAAAAAADEAAAEVRENAGTTLISSQRKIHECPVCLRVFASGQALGGHKRSHVIVSAKTTAVNTSSAPQRTQTQTPTTSCHVKNPSVVVSSTKKSSNKFGEISLIDLNLPAPDDDDEEDDDGEIVSQVELSAVSDAEFVNPIR